MRLRCWAVVERELTREVSTVQKMHGLSLIITGKDSHESRTIQLFIYIIRQHIFGVFLRPKFSKLSDGSIAIQKPDHKNVKYA